MRHKPDHAQPGATVAISREKHPTEFVATELVWALGSLCALHQKNFAAHLLVQEFPPSIPDEGPPRYSEPTLLHASERLGFKVKAISLKGQDCTGLPLPLLIQLAANEEGATPLALITAAHDSQVVVFYAGQNEPQTLTLEELNAQLRPSSFNLSDKNAWLFAPIPDRVKDDSGDAISGLSAATSTSAGPAGTSGGAQGQFNFKWFVPELLRHKTVWRDVLLASLALQLVTLATPLFTQAIIDKVIVHRTQSTLITVGIAMGLLTVLSALMSWGRQYLVLHTGNRVDAVLGAAVWQHLLHLPVRYFERRPTGVVAARLHAVETIREFVSGAAVSLVLDLPFLLICLGVMIWYSFLLSSIAVGFLSIIAIASLIMAPVFQRQLNEQFLLDARNQAFVTEHLAGFETVKTLQMEPQLRQRYSGYLATLLASWLAHFIPSRSPTPTTRWPMLCSSS
jgi:subfamily B ATP-binding cassette protein HlyB/CyaB